MTLVDTSVLLDLVTDDPVWADWSLYQLDAAAAKGPVTINDVVYAELSVRFSTIEALEGVLTEAEIKLISLPREALYLAGKAFARYRAAGGVRIGVLPDFFIGAHAAVAGLKLLTRDANRYRTYFPQIGLITPSPLGA